MRYDGSLAGLFEAFRRRDIQTVTGWPSGLAADIGNYASVVCPYDDLDMAVAQLCLDRYDSRGGLPKMPYAETILTTTLERFGYFFVVRTVPASFTCHVMRWLRQAYHFTGVSMEAFGPAQKLTLIDDAGDPQFAIMLYKLLAIYSELLDLRVRTEAVNDPAIVALNRRRQRILGLDRVQVPRAIHIDRDLITRLSSPSIAAGLPKCPHDRRAHDRRLASGKTVRVVSSKIHGGSMVPREYVVDTGRPLDAPPCDELCPSGGKQDRGDR